MNKDMEKLTDEELEKLRYPIGRFEYNPNANSNSVFIFDIESFPEKLKQEVINLDEEQLNTTYRPGGWTIKQVVHHVADSHMNAYIRIKLVLTEVDPAIKPYFQDRWAELVDTKSDINISLNLLEPLHKRWVMVLKNLSEDDLKKRYFHPEQNKFVSLNEFIANYSWHCKHHLAHITSLKRKMNW